MILQMKIRCRNHFGNIRLLRKNVKNSDFCKKIELRRIFYKRRIFYGTRKFFLNYKYAQESQIFFFMSIKAKLKKIEPIRSPPQNPGNGGGG